ncbi:MAG: glycosylase/AP lyase, DNA-binding [Flaviaesturariibacter sp.]|nr:glycosylase/AP lyase, DNA-binding [Flaviaesturariibacter sp.]
MPEGPSLVILRDEVHSFTGKKIRAVSGNSKQDIARMKGQTVVAFRTWGKHFLICFKSFTVRIHFMLFGKYLINERRDTPARLSLEFSKGEINFYTVSVQFIEEPLDMVYDWSADVMSPEWDPKRARAKLRAKPDMLACDALLDQSIFSGVGNIIKNEVLFRIGVHPESRVGNLPVKKLNALVKEAVHYSFQFLEWKKEYTLKKHWLAHTKRTCAHCGGPLQKKYLGITARRSFFCENCQEKW